MGARTRTLLIGLALASPWVATPVAQPPAGAAIRTCLHLGFAMGGPVNDPSGTSYWPVRNTCRSFQAVRVRDGYGNASQCASIGRGWSTFAIYRSPLTNVGHLESCVPSHRYKGKRHKPRGGYCVKRVAGPMKIIGGTRPLDSAYVVMNFCKRRNVNFQVTFPGGGANGNDAVWGCFNIPDIRGSRVLPIRGVPMKRWYTGDCSWG